MSVLTSRRSFFALIAAAFARKPIGEGAWESSQFVETPRELATIMRSHTTRRYRRKAAA